MMAGKCFAGAIMRGTKMAEAQIILEARNLSKRYPVKKTGLLKRPSVLKAVDDVSLCLREGEVLGIVGESGCGKSTLARMLAWLIRPTSGSVLLLGEDPSGLSDKEIRKLRRNIQVIFQNPHASLDPGRLIRESLAEPLLIHRICSQEEAWQKSRDLLHMVGMDEDAMDKYPEELSGGQLQRICIARALALEPKILICDECVSALDVSNQAQVLNLLMDLRKKLNVSMVFISHDLRVVRFMSTRIAVMYLGRIVEEAGTEELYLNAEHPYTRALLSSVPAADPALREMRFRLTGDIPSPVDLPPGCSFASRCPYAKEECRQWVPERLTIREGHDTLCLRAGEINWKE